MDKEKYSGSTQGAKLRVLAGLKSDRPKKGTIGYYAWLPDEFFEDFCKIFGPIENYSSSLFTDIDLERSDFLFGGRRKTPGMADDDF